MAFDASHAELAVASGDGRVKLFSTAQQTLNADITQTLSTAMVGPGNAPTEIYSCLEWGPKVSPALVSHPPPLGGVTISVSLLCNVPLQGPSQRLLFLGTLAGVVCCYDAARAEVKWTVSGAVDGSIAALACSPDGAGGVLVVSKTGGAAVLEPAGGSVLCRWKASKPPLSKAVALPSGTAIVAGSSVALHDMATGSRLHKWTGHATSVAALAATPDGAFCCSAAQGERTAAMWSAATTPDGKLRHKSAVAQLNLSQPATGLAVVQAGSDRFHVAAVTSTGALALFECVATGEGSVAVRQWGASAEGGGPVLAVALDSGDAAGASVVLAAGNKAKPSFQRCRVDKAEGDAVAQVTVAAQDASLLLPGSAAESAGVAKRRATANGPAAVLGASEGVAVAGRSKRGASAAELDADVAMDDDDDDVDIAVDEDEDDEGPTFAERIAALQQADGGAALPAAGAPGQEGQLAGPVKADSLAVLLTQALQSGDRTLLERCLSVRKEDIINKTVRRLAPADAAAFLHAVVQRLQSAPARGDQLAAWIRAVLLHHTAYLSGVAGAQGTLGYLYQLIEARLASYQPLLALSGRLDLVLANAKRSVGGADDGEEGGLDAGPLVTVEVGSDGAIEVEDAFAGATLESEEEDSDEEESDLSGDEFGFDERDEEDDDDME